jgi:hypothetical protein
LCKGEGERDGGSERGPGKVGEKGRKIARERESERENGPLR